MSLLDRGPIDPRAGQPAQLLFAFSSTSIGTEGPSALGPFTTPSVLSIIACSSQASTYADYVVFMVTASGIAEAIG